MLINKDCFLAVYFCQINIVWVLVGSGLSVFDGGCGFWLVIMVFFFKMFLLLHKAM